MTAEQVYQKFNEQHHLEGNNGGIQKHKHYILQMMNEFARSMCDKQKEICSKQALVKQEYTNNKKEVITNSMQIYNIDKYDSYYFDVEIYADNDSILNAPYPDELL